MPQCRGQCLRPGHKLRAETMWATTSWKTWSRKKASAAPRMLMVWGSSAAPRHAEKRLGDSALRGGGPPRLVART
eukprot:5966105-Prorocentrum_lima.AAC.1